MFQVSQVKVELFHYYEIIIEIIIRMIPKGTTSTRRLSLSVRCHLARGQQEDVFLSKTL